MKNIVMRSILSTLILAGSQICFSATTQAADEVTIELKDYSAFGSGASTSEEHYYPGGVANVGLYLGNPNNTIRNDRALFSFETDTLLLKVDKIKKAEFAFWVEYYDTQEDKVDVEVSRFYQTPDSLMGRQLVDPDVEKIGVIEVVKDDAVSGRPSAEEKRIDVTEALKTALTDGLTTITFRLRVPELESRATGSSVGVLIFAGKNQELKDRWPFLTITLEN